MELDLSLQWRLFLSSDTEGFLAPSALAPILADPDSARGPGEFAAAELARGLGLLAGLRVLPGQGDEAEGTGIIILNPGTGPEGPRSRKGYAWRASPDRVEIHGDSGSGLLAGVEAFLEAAGLSWPVPGEGPHLARQSRVELEASSGRRAPDAPLATLILGHGSYLEAAPDYLAWAARNGYAGVFFHTTAEALALGAAPIKAYEARRALILPLARRLGLELELGGHGLSSFLPRSLFKAEPGLFRLQGGRRRPDANLCPSSPRALEVVSANFSAFVAAHPEVGVFHVWPDDLPGGGWCECPACAGMGPLDQSLAVARALAACLERLRPQARISFLAYHDTGDGGGPEAAAKGAAEGPASVPANLDLLWAPRRRSWARAYGDPACALNAGSAARLEAARLGFFGESGGSGGPAASRARVSVFEYWEDAILFKLAVPPLGSTMAGDLLHYAPRAARVGILLTGARLPLAPRPNPWLLPRLLAAASRPGASPESLAAELETLAGSWAGLVYGQAGPTMAAYWKALEAAWRIDLDLEPGDTELFQPPAGLGAVTSPPTDWGDPWTASPERLGEKRATWDALFALLRQAEGLLAEAQEAGEEGLAGGHIQAEAREYALSSAVLELDGARIAAYHEASRGQARLAADIALIGLGMLYSARRAMRALPDPRARRDGAFLLELFYGLRFRSLNRGARGPVLRGYALGTARLRLAWAYLGMRRLWEGGRT